MDFAYARFPSCPLANCVRPPNPLNPNLISFKIIVDKTVISTKKKATSHACHACGNWLNEWDEAG